MNIEVNQPVAKQPLLSNIIIESGPRITRDINSQHTFAGNKLKYRMKYSINSTNGMHFLFLLFYHFNGVSRRMEFGKTHQTSFLRTASTILSATYWGSSIGTSRGRTPLNIPVLM